MFVSGRIFRSLKPRDKRHTVIYRELFLRCREESEGGEGCEKLQGICNFP